MRQLKIRLTAGQCRPTVQTKDLLPFEDAPRNAVPNYGLLAGTSIGTVSGLAELLRTCTEDQLTVLQFALANAAMIKSAGLSFGQYVWVNMSAPRIEHRQAYMAGNVVAFEIIQDVEYVTLVGELNLKSPTVAIQVPLSSVLTRVEWGKKRKSLPKKKLTSTQKLSIPGSKQHLQKHTGKVQYMLDEVATRKAIAKAKKKQKAEMKIAPTKSNAPKTFTL